MVDDKGASDRGGSVRINLPGDQPADETGARHDRKSKGFFARIHWTAWTAAGLVGAIVLFGAISLILANIAGATEIAKGTTVDGVGVGAMRPSAAAAELDATQIGVNQKPITITWQNQTYTFDPKTANVRVDGAATAAAALAETAHESIWTRAENMYLGKSVDPRNRADNNGISGWVPNIPQHLSAAPVSATVSGTPGQTLAVSQSSDQTGLNQTDLVGQIAHELQYPSDRSNIVAQTGVVATPAESTAQLQADVNGSYFLYVDQADTGPLDSESVSLYEAGKYDESFPVATGLAQWPTQVGLTSIQDHVTCPVWTQPNNSWASKPGAQTPGCAADNPLGKYWMGIGDGEGFHVSPLTVRSHGCIHMNVDQVGQLFDTVPNGTPVFITPLSPALGG